MTAKEVFEALQCIVQKSGMSDQLTVSTDPLEFADFHMVDQNFLGYGETRLFRFESIQRIYYCQNKKEFYHSETVLQILFELNREVIFIIEIGPFGSAWFQKDQKNTCKISDKAEFVHYLNNYNWLERQEQLILSRLHTFLFGFEPEEETAMNTWLKEAINYITDGKDTDNRVLFMLIEFGVVSAVDNSCLIKKLDLAKYIRILLEKGEINTFIEFFENDLVDYMEPDEQEELDRYIDKFFLEKQKLEERKWRNI